MDETKWALRIGIAGFAVLALLVYLTASQPVDQSRVALLPANGSTAIENNPAARETPFSSAKAGNKAGTKAASPATCSTRRLNAWRLVSLVASGYRQGAVAVLNNTIRGSVTVSEAQVFDGNLLLENVTSNAVEIRCDQIVQVKILTDGQSATDAAATPEMRTALPEPSKS